MCLFDVKDIFYLYRVCTLCIVERCFYFFYLYRVCTLCIVKLGDVMRL